QKLEDIIGVKLFERTKNRVHLNENGRLAAECARQILMQEQDMVNRVRALDRSSRMLAVGMISPGPMMELNPLLSSLYPDMTIASELRTEEELLEGLNQGIYQMIILNHKLEDDGLSCHPCGTERLLFAVPPEHRIAGMKECSFKDMDGESFLMASEVGYWDHIVRQQMPNAHFLLQNGLEALHELVRASSLPHFATDLTLRLYGRNPQRAYVPISDNAAVEHFFCYCRRGDEKRFLAWFQALERRFQS
ncbi:MAG: LysR family transcriptional regulator, partial [Clostridia bacterium]|nr:LysR family transcriptional regulator [Clostridia bacterium]